MDPAMASVRIEAGHVWYFDKGRGYGFVTLDKGERNLFFYVAELMKANMDTIEPGVYVRFKRGIAKDGRPKVLEFLEVDGKEVTKGSYSLINGRFVLHRNSTSTVEGARPVISATESKKESTQKSAPSVQVTPAALPTPRINRDEWITVTIRKVRPEHTVYALSESWGQIKVPWQVMQRAKITSARATEKFEVRCEAGEDLPVAHEIRRY